LREVIEGIHNKMRGLNAKIIAFLIIIAIQSIFISSCTSPPKIEVADSRPQNMGNTIGNLLNIGAVANDADNIYYLAASDGVNVTLDKKGIDGGVSQVICNAFCTFVNVAGGFVYYVDNADFTIHKMYADGTHNEKLSDLSASFLFVYDDVIYVLGGEADRFAGKLYAMNNDGSGLRVLADDKIMSINFSNDKLYYLTVGEGQNLLYRMDMDGGNKELISQDAGISDWFCLYKDDVFYLTPGGVVSIRKIDTVTKEDSLVYEIHYEVPNGFINVAGDILYFKSVGTRTYNRLDMDTGEVKTSPMNETTGVGMYTIGNKVFYYEVDTPYMMNIDGSGRQRFD